MWPVVPRGAIPGDGTGRPPWVPLRHAAEQAAAFLLDLVFPEGDECVVCLRGRGSPACAECLASFASWWSHGWRCRVCGRPQRGASGLCGECWRCPPPFNRARSVGVYMGAWRDTIVRFKFGGQRHLARPLGKLALLCYRRSLFPADCVIPVPLAPKRLRQRGYNQSESVARVLARAAGLPLLSRALVRREARHARRRQADRLREERWSILAGEFGPGPECGVVASRSVLLVDDILTTGATASACAQVLLGAGCQRVDVLTLAVGVPGS